VLGHLLERLHGRPLGEVAADLYEELGLELTFAPDPERSAPTEVCPECGRPLRGEVHDENAPALGGWPATPASSARLRAWPASSPPSSRVGSSAPRAGAS
jgi:hypothetical protein